MDLLVLTSSCFPNTNVSTVRDSFSYNQYLYEVRQTICCASCYFKFVVLIDASPEPFFSCFKADLQNLLRRLPVTPRVYIISPNFSQKQLELISIRGKGLSETLMLKIAYDFSLQFFNSDQFTCTKLSSRYSLINAHSVFSNLSRQIKHSDFVIRRSTFYSQVMTVFYCFRGCHVLDMLLNAAHSSFDQTAPYIEHLFFHDVYMNVFVISKPFVCPAVFPNQLRSGSHGRRLSYRVQLRHFLATLF